MSSAHHTAFSHIAAAARKLNHSLPAPEVIFVGQQGDGKSSLIEAFLGHTLLPVGAKKGPEQRPVHINLLNNPACDEPKITIKRDTSDLKAKFPADVEVDVKDAGDAISKRMSVTRTPIYVNYEFKDTWNMTLIDTPGLANDSKKLSAEEIEEVIVEKATASPQALLVFVEEVGFDSHAQMVLVAKKADPKLERSLFVVNKFADQLKNFSSARDLNKYMGSVAPADCPVFFTSLLSPKERTAVEEDGFSARSKFLESLEASTAADVAALEALQYDRRWADAVGVAIVRDHVMTWTWRRYQDLIPELLKKLRAFKRKAESTLTEKQALTAQLDLQKLRGSAARYGVEFLQNVDKLLGGSLEGYPALNGQTLAEEKDACSDAGGDWYSYQHSLVDYDETEVPQADKKLYGGQQFERVLAEFGVVAGSIKFGQLSSDDIATALGASRVSDAAAVTWAASDLVQKHIQRELRPLAKQLVQRSSYVLDRLADIVSNMVAEAHARDDIAMSQFPFFTHSVRSHFAKFVEDASAVCLAKCEDEFMATRLLQWEAANIGADDLKGLSESSSKAEAIVEKIAVKLFKANQKRIIENVKLKTYNYFFVPMQTDLWGELQGELTCFSDAQLEELFEIESSKNRFNDEIMITERVVDQFVAEEAELMKHAATFGARI